MTLVATPGAANADSYVTLNEANAYFTARGVTAWTGIDGDKENALRRATSYLENAYRERWRGLRAAQTQSLAWPRVDGERNPWRQSWTYPLVDADGFQIAVDAVPQQVKDATCEAALLVLGGSTLEPVLARGGAIKSISKGVGPLSKSVTYEDGASIVDRYLVIEGLLSGLADSSPGESSGTIKLVRG